MTKLYAVMWTPDMEGYIEDTQWYGIHATLKQAVSYIQEQPDRCQYYIEVLEAGNNGPLRLDSSEWKDLV